MLLLNPHRCENSLTQLLCLRGEILLSLTENHIVCQESVLKLYFISSLREQSRPLCCRTGVTGHIVISKARAGGPRGKHGLVLLDASSTVIHCDAQHASEF